MAKALAFLTIFHFIFFWKVYSNPFGMARSELLSTFFPSWIHQGRGEEHDPYYWLKFGAHPVLSNYYPIQFLGALAFSRASIETAFKGFLWITFLHLLFGSLGYYCLINKYAENGFVALFGAITLCYGAYNIKQQSCLLYTIAWVPWALLGISTGNQLLAGISFGMILLSGYYPIGIQSFCLLLIAGFAWPSVWRWHSTLWVPIGLLIGLPQLIPFIKYLPKTIRAHQHDGIGKVPWWHPITLIFPIRLCARGVGYWEMAYYVGIVPLGLLFASSSRAWIICVVSYFLMIGVGAKFFPRIPARWSWLFQFSLGWCAVSGLTNMHLTERALAGILLIQAFDLIWHNADLIPTSPYSELPNKPKWAFNTRLTRFLEINLGKARVSGLPYPLFTGHINRFRTLGYCGGMQLKLMAKWRQDKNSNGDGQHDWFKKNEDSPALDTARVRYAYTTARIDWPPTPIRHLYRNPRITTG